MACTVVSDGSIDAGSLGETLIDHHARLPEPFGEATRVTLAVNLLVVESDGVRILFDAGVGISETGFSLFGPSVGRATEALRCAGIEPATIDLVALSHAHPDHAWGLIDTHGQPCFPGARVAVSRAELDYWMGKGSDASTEDDGLAQLIRGGARDSLQAYGSRIVAVEDGEEVAPGVTARELRGHSPGHLVYEIAGADERLVCWGDICHHAIVLADPELSFVFDHDPLTASRSRSRLLTALADSGTAVLAYHLPFPGLGRVTRSRGGGYRWVPRLDNDAARSPSVADQ